MEITFQKVQSSLTPTVVLEFGGNTTVSMFDFTFFISLVPTMWPEPFSNCKAIPRVKCWNSNSILSYPSNQRQSYIIKVVQFRCCWGSSTKQCLYMSPVITGSHSCLVKPKHGKQFSSELSSHDTQQLWILPALYNITR